MFMCSSLGRHLFLRYSSQVVAAREHGDGLCEMVGVETGAVDPHHHTERGRTHDDDLHLQSYKQHDAR